MSLLINFIVKKSVINILCWRCLFIAIALPCILYISPFWKLLTNTDRTKIRSSVLLPLCKIFNPSSTLANKTKIVRQFKIANLNIAVVRVIAKHNKKKWIWLPRRSNLYYFSSPYLFFFFLNYVFRFCAIFTYVIVVCWFSFFSHFSLSFLLRLFQNFVFLYVCVMTSYGAVIYKFVANSWFIFIRKCRCYDKSQCSNRCLLLVLFFVFFFFLVFSPTSSYHVKWMMSVQSIYIKISCLCVMSVTKCLFF